MTTIGKTLFVSFSLAALIAGTLALRGDAATPAPQGRLTPAQVAEIGPPKPAEPPKATRPPSPDDEVNPALLEPELEDGSGS
jgi:hypothetical protein